MIMNLHVCLNNGNVYNEQALIMATVMKYLPQYGHVYQPFALIMVSCSSSICLNNGNVEQH